MEVKKKAFAIMKDESGKEWRVNIYNYDTEEEAKQDIERFKKLYKNNTSLTVEYTGIHNFYIMTKKEYAAVPNDYKGVSLEDGKTKTWVANDEGHCVLLYEHLHFEIV